jgi:hypothetical protein
MPFHCQNSCYLDICPVASHNILIEWNRPNSADAVIALAGCSTTKTYIRIAYAYTDWSVSSTIYCETTKSFNWSKICLFLTFYAFSNDIEMVTLASYITQLSKNTNMHIFIDFLTNLRGNVKFYNILPFLWLRRDSNIKNYWNLQIVQEIMRLTCLLKQRALVNGGSNYARLISRPPNVTFTIQISLVFAKNESNSDYLSWVE